MNKAIRATIKKGKTAMTLFLPEHLAAFAGVDFVSDHDEHMQNPVCTDEPFRNRLIHLSDFQKEPLIYADAQGVFFICLRSGSGHFFFGPMACTLWTACSCTVFTGNTK